MQADDTAATPENLTVSLAEARQLNFVLSALGIAAGWASG